MFATTVTTVTDMFVSDITSQACGSLQISR